MSNWDNLQNILCIRPDNIGDLILTTPALRALKKANRERKITLLAAKTSLPIVPFIKEIDDVIEFNISNYKEIHNDADRSRFQELIQKIKEKNFEAAIIFSVFSQSTVPFAMLCYLAGIPAIAGYARENHPYQFLTHWLPDTEPLFEIKHEVQRQCDLIKSLDIPVDDDHLSLTIPTEAEQSLQIKLKEEGINTNQPWLVIHPGVSEIKRQYPTEKFAEAAKILAEKHNYQIVITGVPSELPLAQQIKNTVNEKAYILNGKISLGELLALIKQAPILISNNTGPVHIAAAVGTPVVDLYALSNPQHTPWKVPNKVLPFPVPDEIKSKNTIIAFANKQAFTHSPQPVEPHDIVEAVLELQNNHTNKESTNILTL